MSSQLTDPQLFKGNFQVDDYINQVASQVLTRDVLAKQTKVTNLATDSIEQLDVQHVQQLCDLFERLGAQLNEFKQQASYQMRSLRKDVRAAYQDFQATVQVVEGEADQCRQTFSQLDSAVQSLSTTSALIGTRLQSASQAKQRSEQQQQLLQYMWLIAHVDTKVDGFNSLPDVFTSDAHLAEAARLSRCLLNQANDIVLNAARVAAASGTAPATGPSPGADTKKGTIQRALANLEVYSADVERRVVSRFDHGVQNYDYAVMRDCSNIMDELGKDTLMHRYISCRPLFLKVNPFTGVEPVVDPNTATQAIRALAAEYRDISGVVKEEMGILSNVFSQGDQAKELFIRRVLEQKVGEVLDKILVLPSPDCSSLATRSWLKMLLEAYTRTMTLAENIQQQANVPIDVYDMAGALFSNAMTNYMTLERRWMAQYFEEQTAGQTNKMLDVGVVEYCFTCFIECVERCTALAPAGQRAAYVRSLLHTPTQTASKGSCLMDQIARLVIQGISHAGSSCEAAHVSAASAVASSSWKGGKVIAREGIGSVLDCVESTCHVLSRLHTVYNNHVHKHVSLSAAELATCNQGLTTFGCAVEERIVQLLTSGLEQVLGLINKLISALQKRADFYSSDGDAINFDQPTAACVKACDLLFEVIALVQIKLKSSNKVSFLTELGVQCGKLFTAHMLKFVYSPLGALRWKADVSKYYDTVRQINIQSINDVFEHLQQLTSILMVAPVALQGLVDSTLCMPYKQALQYISLREDYKTAKVGNRTLKEIFSSDM